MATPRISESGELSEYLIFIIIIFFFQKIQHKILHLEIQFIFSILWVRHLRIGSN